jgi:hypothetical protein
MVDMQERATNTIQGNILLHMAGMATISEMIEIHPTRFSLISGFFTRSFTSLASLPGNN